MASNQMEIMNGEK